MMISKEQLAVLHCRKLTGTTPTAKQLEVAKSRAAAAVAMPATSLCNELVKVIAEDRQKKKGKPKSHPFEHNGAAATAARRYIYNNAFAILLCFINEKKQRFTLKKTHS